jgi:cold shock CspA family protein
MQYGKIARFDTDRGFGFITPDAGGTDVFLHVSALGRGADVRLLIPGTRVSYEEASGDRGVKAAQVRVVTASLEDSWPEFSADVKERVVRLKLTEHALQAVFAEAWDLVLARARENGWLA